MRLISVIAAAVLAQITSAAIPAAEDGKKMSPVLRALMSIQGEAFVPPAQNEPLQALLRQHPKLDFFEIIGSLPGEEAFRTRNEWNAFRQAAGKPTELETLPGM